MKKDCHLKDCHCHSHFEKKRLSFERERERESQRQTQKPVAQGQYVVSETRCPALHDYEFE